MDRNGDLNAPAADWVMTQQKTFTKWCNNHLVKKGYAPLEDPVTEFDDGIKLMELVNALYSLPIPKHNKNPRMRPQKLDNINSALEMVKEAEIKTNFLGGTNLIEHDRTMILGMIWAIILDYAIKGISVDELTAKEGLLLWCRKKTEGYNHVDPPKIQNFHTHWRNGLALLALIHRHRPDLLNYSDFDPNNAEANINTAFTIAEEELGIPRLLDVEDLNVPRPDERSVMTYVSEFFHKFADQGFRENAARRVQNFLNFAREMEHQQYDYERRARALLEWVGQQIQRFVAYQPPQNADQGVTDFNAFRAYVVSEKPPMAGEKLDVEALYVEIQTQLAVNGRPPYKCPDDVHPDVLDQAFNDLLGHETSHSKVVRDARVAFVESKHGSGDLDAKQQSEFEASFDHFDGDKSGTLDKIEFKAALSAVGVPFRDDEAFNKLYLEVAGGIGKRVTKQAFINYLTKLHEDKDSPEQIIASFKSMADQNSTISRDQLACHPLTEEDVLYLTEQMSGDPNFNYEEFVARAFA